MMYWGNGMNGWGTLLMVVSNVLFWSLIIGAIVLVARYLAHDRRAAGPTSRERTPQQVLADRFAHGDIDEEEYARRLRVLDDAAHSHRTVR
ncbi:SHOCT domain-containing protein [Asanoa sp. NPDC049573]|uniref:SHOCT domain-containing protein n=1 Tax=Asanoa sp. NPDC049573 TaxID=3155396 RepID=UPI00341369D2